MSHIPTRTVSSALLVSVIAVFGIDYPAHLFFSEPMETLPYFLTKLSLYFVFSIVFLSVISTEKNELLKVIIGGIAVSLMWGTYYNILPALFEYYPYGIPLMGITFLGMGLLGTGVAFGVVHSLAFVGGYYASGRISKYLS